MNRVPDLKYCLSLMKQGLTSSDLGMTDKYLLQGIPNMILTLKSEYDRDIAKGMKIHVPKTTILTMTRPKNPW